MNYGITPQGFVKKPYSVILSEMQDIARDEDHFGPDIDLSSTSPLGAEIQLMAWTTYQQWELAEDVYYSRWLSTAEGASLDRVVKAGFVSRQPGVYALVSLLFSGDPGTPIPMGTQAETNQDVVFETIEEGSTDDDGNATIAARCTVSGTEGIVPAGSIIAVKTPVDGIESVTNPDPSSDGRGAETDAELRERYTDLPTSTGSSVEAIHAALRNVSGVTSVKVFENDGNAPDENGLPEKAIEAVIQGGDDDDIGKILLSKKPGGIQLAGSESVTVVDTQGVSRVIHFSRPEDVNVYIVFDILKNDDWSDNNLVLIKRNAITYVGGVDDLSVEHAGVGISKTVFAWKLPAAQSGIIGIDEITVKIGRTVNPTHDDNLEFTARERPRTDVTKITINSI